MLCYQTYLSFVCIVLRRGWSVFLIETTSNHSSCLWRMFEVAVASLTFVKSWFPNCLWLCSAFGFTPVRTPFWRVCLMVDQMSFWMCGWLTDQLTAWLTDRSVYWFIQQIKNVHAIAFGLSFTATVLCYYCSSICPSSNLLSIHLSIPPSFHRSIHLFVVNCCHASTHLSLHIFICPSLCSQFSHVCFCFICMLWCSVSNGTCPGVHALLLTENTTAFIQKPKAKTKVFHHLSCILGSKAHSSAKIKLLVLNTYLTFNFFDHISCHFSGWGVVYCF